MWYVYRHIRLDTNSVFYIGVGKRLDFRRARTIVRRSQFWKNIVAKTKWVSEVIMDNLTQEGAMAKEIEFISMYGRNDLGLGTLANLTNGGEGTSGLKVSEALKDRLSIINKGKTLSEDHKRKISAAHKGKIFSEVTLERMSNARMGTKQSPETIAKRRLKMMGNKSHSGKTWSIENGKRVYKPKVL